MHNVFEGRSGPFYGTFGWLTQFYENCNFFFLLMSHDNSVSIFTNRSVLDSPLSSREITMGIMERAFQHE